LVKAFASLGDIRAIIDGAVQAALNKRKRKGSKLAATTRFGGGRPFKSVD
jgi:hypothetical protein